MSCARTDIAIIDDRDLLISVFSELIYALWPGRVLRSFRSISDAFNDNLDAKVYLVNSDFLTSDFGLISSFDLSMFPSDSSILLIGNAQKLAVPARVVKMDIHAAGVDAVDVLRSVFKMHGLLSAAQSSTSNQALAGRDLNYPAVGGRGLTPKQVRILDLAANGLSAQEIARELNVTVNTVRGHVQEIFVRLNVKNIAHAVALYTKANAVTRFDINSSIEISSHAEN